MNLGFTDGIRGELTLNQLIELLNGYVMISAAKLFLTSGHVYVGDAHSECVLNLQQYPVQYPQQGGDERGYLGKKGSEIKFFHHAQVDRFLMDDTEGSWRVKDFFKDHWDLNEAHRFASRNNCALDREHAEIYGLENFVEPDNVDVVDKKNDVYDFMNCVMHKFGGDYDAAKIYNIEKRILERELLERGSV